MSLTPCYTGGFQVILLLTVPPFFHQILMNVRQMRIDVAINATTRKEATHVPVWTALDWTLIISLA